MLITFYVMNINSRYGVEMPYVNVKKKKMSYDKK